MLHVLNFRSALLADPHFLVPDRLCAKSRRFSRSCIQKRDIGHMYWSRLFNNLPLPSALSRLLVFFLDRHAVNDHSFALVENVQDFSFLSFVFTGKDYDLIVFFYLHIFVSLARLATGY